MPASRFETVLNSYYMKVHALYFSATHTTKRVVEAIASSLSSAASSDIEIHDVTSPSARAEALSFTPDDIVIFGVPVYIGRVPNLIKPYLETVCGGGASGVPVVVYGNRNYDDALVELCDMMTGNGFRCVGAAAFIGEHSFSRALGAGRPDHSDIAVAEGFGRKIANIASDAVVGPCNDRLELCITGGLDSIPGNRPYRFFRAVDDDGKPFDIRKVKPVTDSSKCTDCGLCAQICPMGAIDSTDAAQVTGICIKCGACVKRCPSGAKSFTDGEYLRHLAILERDNHRRREPELFL